MLIASVALTLGAGCYRLPETLEMPEVRGRVVDAETGQPIAGAEVFIFQYAESRALLAIGSVKLGTQFQTTDANGEFRFPASTISVPRQFRQHWRLFAENPSVVALHREYGWGGVEPNGIVDSLAVKVEMKRDPLFIEDMRDPYSMDDPLVCGGFSDAHDNSGMWRCCDVLYGADAEVCRRPGPRRPAVLREMEEEFE